MKQNRRWNDVENIRCNFIQYHVINNLSTDWLGLSNLLYEHCIAFVFSFTWAM